MLDFLSELPQPYVAAKSLKEDCPYDWAIGRDPACYKNTVRLCYEYLEGKDVDDPWDILPYAEAKDGDYLIIYHEDLPFHKSNMKAYQAFHHLKPYLDKLKFIEPWKVSLDDKVYGLGIWTPDMYWSFFSKTEDDIKRNRVWAMKNMILTTQKYSGEQEVICLAACAGNCKKMKQEYIDARVNSNISRFGRYYSELFEPVWEVRWTSQRPFSYKKALISYELN